MKMGEDMTSLIEEDLDKAGIAGQAWEDVSRSRAGSHICALQLRWFYKVNRQPCRANIRSKAGYSVWELVLVVEESSRRK
jgi:hypothetical protein